MRVHHSSMQTGEGWREVDEEDHVTGLVKQIVHAMLEEEDDGIGIFSPRNVRRSIFPIQTFAGTWYESAADDLEGLEEGVNKRPEDKTIEVLYTELVRLKMEELAVAQQRLSLYQKSLVGGKQASFSQVVTINGPLSMSADWMYVEERNSTLESSPFQPLHCQQTSSEEGWETPYKTHWQNNLKKMESTSMHHIGRHPVRWTPPLGGSFLRESGGTGVFLPRCRTGARHMCSPESKQRTDYQCPASTQCTKAALSTKRKEDMERPALQYTSSSSMQEVSGDISLPTEWTY